MSLRFRIQGLGPWLKVEGFEPGGLAAVEKDECSNDNDRTPAKKKKSTSIVS